MDQNPIQLRVVETIPTNGTNIKVQSNKFLGFIWEKSPKFINHYRHCWDINVKEMRLLFGGFLSIVFSNFDYFLGIFIILDLQKEFKTNLKIIGINGSVAVIARWLGCFVFRILIKSVKKRLLVFVMSVLLIAMYILTSKVTTIAGYSVLRAVTSILCGMYSELGNMLITSDLRSSAVYIYTSFAGLSGGLSYVLVPFYMYMFHSEYNWRPLFLIGAFIIFGIGVFVFFCIEEDFNKKTVITRRCSRDNSCYCRAHGALIYITILTFAWNTIARGTQDLYPTILRLNSEISFTYSILGGFLAGCGALVGGLTLGIIAPFMGYQRMLIAALVLFFASFMIANFGPATPQLIICATFFVQLFIQLGFSILPYHIGKNFHPDHRPCFPRIGIVIGTLLASGTFEIQIILGEYLGNSETGEMQYGLVQFWMVVAASVILALCTIVGGWNVYPDVPCITQGASSEPDPPEEENVGEKAKPTESPKINFEIVGAATDTTQSIGSSYPKITWG